MGATVGEGEGTQSWKEMLAKRQGGAMPSI